MNDARNSEIKRATEQAKVSDTLIMQKINQSHRLAFVEKFPGQLEHILRLLTERLQAGLDKRDGVDVNDPDTWKMHPDELSHLARAILDIHSVRKELKHD